MTIPIELLIAILTITCAIIGGLIGLVAKFQNGRLEKLELAVATLTAALVGPDSKIVSYGKCQLEMADIKESVHILDKKVDEKVGELHRRLDEHIESAA